MGDIGLILRDTREKSGVTKEEASKDLDIKLSVLENIENGNIGCFKDIFVLKDYIRKYAKYLGLDPEKIIDEFNEYLFEYTSKIPIKSIEKAIKAKKEEKPKKEEVSSPYTKIKNKHTTLKYVLIYIGIAILVALVILWSVNQVTTANNKSETAISLR